MTRSNVLVEAFRSSIRDGWVGVETPAVRYEYFLSSPFLGEAQSCKEALSSFNVGDDGLSGALAGAGGGQAGRGDCILRRGRGRGLSWRPCLGGAGPAARARLE